MKKPVKIAIILSIIAVIIAASAIVGASIYRSSPNYLLSAAERYLTEMNYEEAIIAFEKYLEIEPRDAEAYLGLIEAYEAMGEYDKAEKIRQKAFELTGDSRFLAGIPGGESRHERAIAELIKNPDADIDQSLLDCIRSVEIIGDEIISVNRSIFQAYKYDGCSYGDSTFTVRSDNEEKTFNFGRITSLDFVKRLNNLTSLSVECNQINDISSLSEFTNLRNLNLFHNQISDIRPLSELTNLTYLSLKNNKIDDISPLKKLANLRNLNLSDNKIVGISPLSKLTNLEELNLFRNQISDISPLSELTNLTFLLLSNNQIRDISPLSELTNLTHLDLEYNQISDISPLSRLTNLTALDLQGNDSLTQAQINELQEKLKDCSISAYARY